MTADDLITRKDLADFKTELFEFLTSLNNGQHITQKWLKTRDVLKILDVSAGTLHNLRINGTIPFNKVGNKYYYKNDDLDKVLNGPEKKRSKQSK